jgi:hypothetical protein
MSSRDFPGAVRPNSCENGGFDVVSAISCAVGSSLCLVMRAPFRMGHHAASLPWQGRRATGTGGRLGPLLHPAGVHGRPDRRCRGLAGVVDADLTARRATVWAGTTIGGLGPLLWEHGLAPTPGSRTSWRSAGRTITSGHCSTTTSPASSAYPQTARTLDPQATSCEFDGRPPRRARSRVSLPGRGEDHWLPAAQSRHADPNDLYQHGPVK